DMDVFGYHYENDMLAVNVFHMRGGKILDRREFFWEELPETAGPPSATDEPTISPAERSENNNRGPDAPPPVHLTNDHDQTAALAAVENSPARAQASSRAEAQVPGARSQDPGALAPAFNPGEFFSALMKQIYIDQQYVPRDILSPIDFEDRAE